MNDDIETLRADRDSWARIIARRVVEHDEVTDYMIENFVRADREITSRVEKARG